MAQQAQELRYECVFKLSRIHNSWISALAFATTGNLLASASADGTIFIIDVLAQSALLAVDFEHPVYPTCVVWLNGVELVVGRSDGGVQFFQVDQRRVSRTALHPLEYRIADDLNLRLASHTHHAGLGDDAHEAYRPHRIRL